MNRDNITKFINIYKRKRDVIYDMITNFETIKQNNIEDKYNITKDEIINIKNIINAIGKNKLVYIMDVYNDHKNNNNNIFGGGIDKVSGIFRVSKMVSKDKNKTIFLFSDKHTPFFGKTCNNGTCDNKTCQYYFLNILENLISSTTDMVDFYIEDIIYDKKYPFHNITLDCMLKRTLDYFIDCHNTNKQKCKEKWKNLRYHYSDLRIDPRHGLEDVYINKYNYVSSPLHILCNLINNSIFDHNSNIKDLIYFVNAANKILSMYKKDPKKYYSKFLQSQRINKQIKNVDPKIVNIIKNVIIEEKVYTIKLSFVIANKIISYYTSNPSSSENNYKILREKILNYYYYILDINSAFMDLYLMCRMFRSFDGKPQNKVIVYAGYYHILTYEKVLSELQFSLDVYGYKMEDFDMSDFFCTKIPNNFIHFD